MSTTTQQGKVQTLCKAGIDGLGTGVYNTARVKLSITSVWKASQLLHRKPVNRDHCAS